MQRLILTLGLIGVLFINLKADEVGWETFRLYDLKDNSTDYVCPRTIKYFLEDWLFRVEDGFGKADVELYRTGKTAITDKPITEVAKRIEAYEYVPKLKKLDEKIGQEFLEYAKKLNSIRFKIANDVCVSEAKTNWDNHNEKYRFFEQPKKTLDEFFKTIDSYFE